eukprot:CAMPEP_0172314942 /NCGR_PEP_ID=MMETSP1058-20130122/23607_1 /TAXON_ID=83371 /ORGANISM="Detonula confervacea, Strain CCMP 353" /LENGTH=63 /DNA_ID=CAMNT_0013028901 /DNA_START=68 /DNA_END=256 /DNA_ORIENTATION=-
MSLYHTQPLPQPPLHLDLVLLAERLILADFELDAAVGELLGATGTLVGFNEGLVLGDTDGISE